MAHYSPKFKENYAYIDQKTHGLTNPKHKR